jgi:hypothetical protein
VTSVEPAPASTSRNLAFVIPGAIGIFVAVIASLAAYFLWPRGHRIGTLNLLAPAPSLGVDLAAGETLSFRFEVVTVGTRSGYPSSSRGRTNAVHDQLAASAMTVTLVREGAPGIAATCGAFDGKATMSSPGSDSVESSGLPLRCSLVAKESGRHTLTARVAWVPKDVREAMLEVRRQRAGD